MADKKSWFRKASEQFTQEEVEENPQSLSARAFRKRLLEDENGLDNRQTRVASLASVNRPEVAVYHDTSFRWRRLLVRIVLTVVAPLIAIALIAYVVVNNFQQQPTTAPIVADTVALDVVPVPAGVRPISRAKMIDQAGAAKILYDAVLPQYLIEFKGAVSYLSPQPLDTVANYYKNKLVDPRPPPWQLFAPPTFYGNFYTAIYLRALNNQGLLESIAVRLDTVDPVLLRSDPEFYDRQAKVGETAMVLWRVWLKAR